MKILFISPRLPFPLDTGGKIRTFNILKQLAKKNIVHLVSFSFEPNDRDYIADFEKLGVEVNLVPMEEPTVLQKISVVLLNPIPYSINKYNTLFMRQAIEDLCKTQSFDAVHVDHLHMAHYTDLCKNIPCFLDEHNVEYRILERCGDVETNLLKKLLYRQQSFKMKAFEAKKIKEFWGVFCCSLDDQRLLSSLSPGRSLVHVVANGVDTEFFNTPRPNGEIIEEDALVFTGSMDWLPNDDSITYFCGKILPLIWQKNGSIRFYVVGKNPSTMVKDLAKHDNRVIVTGRVDDVRSYIHRSKVFIVPLRIGGGTRLKILEAMSMGKVVVSTSIGAEGIECTDGQNILLGDQPQDFADKVLSLFNDPQRSKDIGLKARQFVCERYDWDIIGQKLNAIYEEKT